MRISVIVPTRHHVAPATGEPYWKAAIASIKAQTTDAQLDVLIRTDPSPVPLGQAKTVNGAAAEAGGDLLAFLEDDDTWDPGKISTQLPFLNDFDLVTCAQREVDERRVFLRDSYYPTPSGWLMRRTTWDLVGGFDEQLQFHVDTEWLGRANRVGVRRVHLVHSSADSTSDRWVSNMTESSIVLGTFREPLVTRTVRSDSLTGSRRRDIERRVRSDADYQTIMERFGKVPW